MRRVWGWLGALGVLALVVSTGAAQPPEGGAGGRGGRGPGGSMGGGGPAGLLRSKEVQQELGLTDDQAKKAEDVAKKVNDKHQEERAALRDLDPEEQRTKRMELQRTVTKETMDSLGDVLKPEQAKRLKQLALQARGAGAFQDSEVQSELKLSDEQKDKIKTISDDARKEMQEAFTGGGAGGDRAAMAKKMASLRKETMEKAMAVLNADQKTKWEEMTGKPFEFHFGQGGGRRGGR